MVKVTINIPVNTSLDESEDKIKGFIKKGVNYTAQDLLANLQNNSPVDTGLLKQWFVYQKKDDYVDIRSPAKYVGYVNDGTGIYGPSHAKIKPKHAKVLRFTKGGTTFFAKSVKGQKGQKFVEKSIKETSSKVEQLFIRAKNEEGL